LQPGEIVVAHLSRGATVVRYQEETATRVSVLLGRNKLARIPSDRILFATGVVASAQDKFEDFRDRSQHTAADIDLTEVWDVLTEDAGAISLEEMAELYWDSSPDAARLVALALHLDGNTDLFVREGDRYEPRTREAVADIQVRRARREQNAADALSLMTGLAQGAPPEELSKHQEMLLGQLRDYAIHGEESSGHDAARALLESVVSRTRDQQRRCFELLVDAGVFSPDEPLELHRAGIREQFPEDAVDEAASLALDHLLQQPHRRDLTGLAAITIDDAEAEDRDDALSVKTAEDGGYRIGVHIADAGSLIPLDGAVDREADRRMATLYMPERNIGMLPPGLAKRLGSLDAGETRCAMSLLVSMDASGEILDWEVTPSVVRSHAALSYEEADRALKDRDGAWGEALAGLNVAARALRDRRELAGAINIDQAEMLINLRPSGEVEVRVHDRSSPARLLVTELMIMCNSLLAEFCRDNDLPAVYRSQTKPDISDLELETPEGQAEEALQRYMVTRRLAPAHVSTTPLPHGGLGVEAYVQATSPLRRYPDLVIQRQITHFLTAGEPLYPPEKVASVGQRADVQLRELAQLENMRNRYWFLKYLQQSRLEDSGAAETASLFPGTVLDNQPRRLAMLELDEFPTRVRAELPQSWLPGDTVTLKLQGVDLWRRFGLFVHVP
jgi:exoribonuclease-2